MFENLSVCSQNKVAASFVRTVSSGCGWEEMDTEECFQSVTVYFYACWQYKSHKRLPLHKLNIFFIMSTKNEHHHLYLYYEY